MFTPQEQDSMTDAQNATDLNDGQDPNDESPKPTGFDALPEETKAEIRRLRRENAGYRKDADARSKADADAEQKRQESAGEYEAAKAALTKDRDDAYTARDAVVAENEIYATIFEAQYAEGVKAIPASIWDVIKPADDASLVVRMEQLQKAKKLADEFGTATTTGGGSRATPKPTHTTTTDEDQRARAATRPPL